MPLKTPPEWYECIEAGAAAVRHPYSLRQFRRVGIPRVSIYHLPSFVDCTGWTVYEVPGNRDYELQTVTWRQQDDSQRMQEHAFGRISPQPTLEETSRPLMASWFEQQFRALAEITIPLHTVRSEGLDGETFGVHIRSEFSVEWWCDGPAEWVELVQWTRDCIEYFQQGTTPGVTRK